MSLSTYALEGMVEGLEEVLLANPDDLFTHRAYADLLFRQRHPALAARGRLIETQLRLEETGPGEEHKKLERRSRKLLKEHGRFWLGELAPYLLDQQGTADRGEYRFTFARGWLDTITAPLLCPEFARVLARAPQARLLRQLVLEDTAPGGAPALAALHQAPFLQRLRVFQVGPDLAPTTGKRACWPSGVEGVVELAARMPRLEELYLQVQGIEAGRLLGLEDLAGLRVLHLVDEDGNLLTRRG